MELRVHGDAKAIRAPTGWIPRHEDVARLFTEVLNKPYSREDYEAQFTVRVPELLAKGNRVERFIHDSAADAPPAVLRILGENRQRLLEAQRRHGDYISPGLLPEA